MSHHGHAAFCRAEIQDAKRGHPAVELQPYAAARRLEFHGRGMLTGFRGALPRYVEYQHNLMRGVLPGGRFGVLLHELLKTHDGADMGMCGSFWSVTIKAPGGWRAMFDPRAWARGDGDFEDPGPFGETGAWSPCTTAGVPVPETVAVLPWARFIRRDRTPRWGGEHCHELDGRGMKGWRVYLDERADPGAVDRLLSAGAFRAAIAPLLDLPYAELRVDRGMLRVRRNGFVIDDAELDTFARAACGAAGALAAACLPSTAPAPFAEALPDAVWAVADVPSMDSDLLGGWSADLRDYAARHRCVVEDAATWHRAFPRSPIPGKAVAVLRHPSGARILFTTDVPVRRLRAVRGAVAFPAAGAPDTPPGGLRDEASQTVCFAADGVVSVVSQRHFGYARDADTLLADARRAAEAADLPVAQPLGV